MAKAKPGLLASLKTRAVDSCRKNQTWFDKLPAEAKAELNEAKASFLRGEIVDRDGRMPMSRFAELLSAEMAEREIASVGRQGIENWLKRK
jgi:hypothetical protein